MPKSKQKTPTDGKGKVSNFTYEGFKLQPTATFVPSFSGKNWYIRQSVSFEYAHFRHCAVPLTFFLLNYIPDASNIKPSRPISLICEPLHGTRRDSLRCGETSWTHTA